MAGAYGSAPGPAGPDDRCQARYGVAALPLSWAQMLGALGSEPGPELAAATAALRTSSGFVCHHCTI
jgi:hypothetical protein